jgi:hypothetical protein
VEEMHEEGANQEDDAEQCRSHELNVVSLMLTTLTRGNRLSELIILLTVQNVFGG